jgi:hypothetical protein
VQPLAQLRPNILELGRHALAHRPPLHREVSRLVAGPTDVGETQKIKGLRLPFSSLGPSLGGVAPESIRRVFSGCSSSPNFRTRSSNSFRNFRRLPGARTPAPHHPHSAPR